MTQLLSTLAALLALTGPASVHALPQVGQVVPASCKKDAYEYAPGVQVSDPYFTDAAAVGGMSCPSGEKGGCTHTKTYTHMVTVTYGVNGGFSGLFAFSKVFTLGVDAGFSVSWATTEMDARGSSIECPKPDKGSYECGLQVRPKKVKITGKVRKLKNRAGCPQVRGKNGPWKDYHVEAPYKIGGGANKEQEAAASFEPCIMSCGGKDANSLDCEGVKSLKGKVPICPDASMRHDFNEGWCTGHITQRQRGQKAVGNTFRFDVKLFDGKKKEFLHVASKEVDKDGNLSIPSLLPFTFDIKAKGGDKDPVKICYADQCFSCPGGGPNGCTLGDGEENGYEGGNREGDFGFTCKHKKK